jgi:hypothetical protein
MNNVEKYGRAGLVIDDNITRRTPFACWTAKATNTHSEHVYLLLFHGDNCRMNTPECCVYTHTAYLHKDVEYAKHSRVGLTLPIFITVCSTTGMAHLKAVYRAYINLFQNCTHRVSIDIMLVMNLK